MKSYEYLQQVKDKYDLPNDSALARHVGLAPNSVSQYLSGKRIMENEPCLKVAAALNLADPTPIIIAADIERAEKAGTKSMWERFSPRVTAASLATPLAIAFVTNFLTSNPTQASIAGHISRQVLALC